MTLIGRNVAELFDDHAARAVPVHSAVALCGGKFTMGQGTICPTTLDGSGKYISFFIGINKI